MSAFFTADWHLGAPDMWLMGRPFSDHKEMADRLIREHNAVVDPGDTVFMLGDALHTGADRLAPVIDAFNGNLVLFRGNHDTLPDKVLRRHFVEVVAEGDGMDLVVDGLDCWLTHYPTRGRADRFNLVGHIHDRWKVQKNMVNVGVDVHHFQPVPADRIGFYFRAICDFYDEDVWVADHLANAAHADRGAAGTYFKARS
jgi:calcineurin-like phosphoesterase family protein